MKRLKCSVWNFHWMFHVEIRHCCGHKDVAARLVPETEQRSSWPLARFQRSKQTDCTMEMVAERFLDSRAPRTPYLLASVCEFGHDRYNSPDMRLEDPTLTPQLTFLDGASPIQRGEFARKCSVEDQGKIRSLFQKGRSIS